MRAGPLSDDSIINELNSEFVNTWIIIPQMEKPEEFFDDPTARDWASVVQSGFTYPVDSLVLSSSGKILSQGEYREVNSVENYMKMIGRVKTVDEKK